MVVALLGCFGWMASLAVKNTGFERWMFALIAGLVVLVFFAVLLSS